MRMSTPLATFLCLVSAIHAIRIRIRDGDDIVDDSPATIVAEAEVIQLNVNNVSNSLFDDASLPNPDITILSQQFFLCIWSYLLHDSDTGAYSNEIYANLFDADRNKALVSSEFLLNKLQGYSQDTPSASALFNSTNHATQSVAVVWESQVQTDSGFLRDAVYGRIINWLVEDRGSYRYIRVTSPSSEEFMISSVINEYMHHREPDVVPIYGTEKFLVSWMSVNSQSPQSALYIRIYDNDGTMVTEPINVDQNDLSLMKFPRALPMLHNLTLLSWLSQSPETGLTMHAEIVDAEGGLRLNDGDLRRYTSQSLYESTVPAIAHLHNDARDNNNYFVLAWPVMSGDSNTMYGAVYRYNDAENAIEQISEEPVTLFAAPFFANTEYRIEMPQMENIENEVYEYVYGLSAKVALCYSLKDVQLDTAAVYCKLIAVTLWSDEESVVADIALVSNATMVSADPSGGAYQHEHPQIASAHSLRGAQADAATSNVSGGDPRFMVVWSTLRDNGYDVYGRVLQVATGGDGDEVGGDGESTAQHTEIFGSELTTIIISVVFGIILVVVGVCVCNHLYLKCKGKKSATKINQLGDDSDDDDEEDTNQFGNTRGSTEHGEAPMDDGTPFR